MALKDEILTLKNKEGTLTGNKVCNFAYDDTAFEDDTTTGANGVTTYNYNNHNNIPVKDPTVLKTNNTIISKGFRSQVSVLPRMLLNHIFGRVSYNLNKTVDTFNSLLSNLYNYIGQPNGLATLDNTGRLPYSQLPLSAVEYKGAWNASTNTPTLASGTGTFGDEYIVNTQGTQNLGEGNITYRVGDRVIYNGSIWQRIPASSVRTVNSKTPDANGNVTINASDMVTPDVYGYDKTNMGKIWTRIINGNISSSNFFGFDFIHSANNLCIARKSGAIPALEMGLYWSEDGVNWNQCTGCEGKIFNSVYFANGLWVAGGGSPYGFWWSYDGKSWSQTQGGTPSNLAIVGAICYGNGIWVAGTGGGETCWSYDGKNWTEVSSVIGNHSINTICYADGLFVAGTSSNGFIWSEDGKVWTPCTGGTTYSVLKVVFYNGIWVAGVSSHGLWWSENGKDWYIGLSDTTGSGRAILYADNLWVATVDPVTTGSHPFFWSSDGKNWNEILDGENYSFTDLIYKNNLWFACSVYGGVWWSNNGKNWAQGTGGYCEQLGEIDGILIGCCSTRFVSKAGMYNSIGSLTNNVAQILDWLLYAVDNLLN